MIKFVPIVLYFLYYISIITSAPVIKATGVQWSEPRGTGKGNITLIMIPQNNSCGEDADMIVAVKSDYQIQSQDTQLLNLVVNENKLDKKNISENDIGIKCKKNNEKQSGNNIKNFYNAKYFEPLVKPGDKNTDDANVSTASVTTEQNGLRDVTINILNFVGLTSPIYSTNSKGNGNWSASADGTEHVLRVVNLTEPVGEISKQNHGEFERSNVSSINSEANFLNEALNLLEKLKQDPSNHDSLKYSKDFVNTNGEARVLEDIARFDSKTKHSKGDDSGLPFDEGEMFVKEFELPIKNDKVNLEGDPGGVTTCIPFEIGNEQTVSESKETSLQGSEIGMTPNTLTTETGVTHGVLQDTNTGIALGGKENVQKLETTITEQTNIASNTEKCSTVIVKCDLTGSNDVFEQISHMVNENTKIEMTTPVISVSNNIGAGFGNLEKTSTECTTISEVGINKEPGKLEPPKKVTLEPHIDCKTYTKINEHYTTISGVDNLDTGLKERDLNPLVESSVFLANNIEMPRGKDIPIVLNTSLNEYSLTDLQEIGDKMHGKVAELYNNNPLVLNIETERLQDSYPRLIKYNDNTKISIQPPTPPPKKIHYSDINEILKMHFAGKKVILEQKPSYRSGVANEECDHTQESKTESLNLEMEPDDEETPEIQSHLTKEMTSNELDSNQLKKGHTTIAQPQEERTIKHLIANTKPDDEEEDLMSDKSITKKLSSTKLKLDDNKLKEKDTIKQPDKVLQGDEEGESTFTIEKDVTLKLDKTGMEVGNRNQKEKLSTKHSESTPQFDEGEESLLTTDKIADNAAETLGTTKIFGLTEIYKDTTYLKEKGKTKYSESTSILDEYNPTTLEEGPTNNFSTTTRTQTDEEEDNLRLITVEKNKTEKLSSSELTSDSSNYEMPLEKSTTNHWVSTEHKEENDSLLMTQKKQGKLRTSFKPDFSEGGKTNDYSQHDFKTTCLTMKTPLKIEKEEKLQTKFNSLKETTTMNSELSPILGYDDSLPVETTKKCQTTKEKLETTGLQENLRKKTSRSTLASTLSANDEEDLQSEYPVRNITKVPVLPNKDDSNRRYTSEVQFNKEKCSTKPVKEMTATASVTLGTATTSIHKPYQKGLRIPADSINEIVIQIVRNTRKPKKLDKFGSNKCQKSVESQYGRNPSQFKISQQYKDRSLQKTPYLDLNPKSNSIESINFRLSGPPKYSYGEQPSNLESPKVNLDILSIKNALPHLSSSSVEDKQREINSNKRKAISKEKITAKLNKPIINTDDSNEQCLANNILKLLVADKEKIKMV